ncbi:MAG TPA: AAA family ATPase [Actinomycetota bacterium]|nr:AAA family ATPase [Actinomycetota bacterium]
MKPSPSPDDRTDLLEREPEVEIIAGALDGLATGRGGFLVVDGPAGIGKSELLSAGATMARQRGAEVLSARGTELEAAFAYGVVRQLFEPALSRLSADDREELFQGAAAGAGRLLTSSSADPDPPAPTPGAAMTIVHSLWWLTANLAARRPLLLALDDAHWSDPASLQLFAYLLNRVESLPVAVLVSVRTGEPGPPVLDELTGEPAVVLRPGNLSEQAAGRLAACRLVTRPAESFVHSLHSATRGNPLLLNELLRTVAERSIPADDAGAKQIAGLESPSVSRAVVRRVRRLGPEALELTRALAAWGGRAELRQAAAVAGLDDAAAGRTADALAAVEILSPGRPLEFVHPLVRTALYSDMPPAVRAQAHAAVAEVLRRDGAPVERVAAHLLHTEPAADEAVVDTLRTAAREALARGAPESARRYLERALREPPAGDSRGRVLCKLGVAEMRVDPKAAVGHITAAMEFASEQVARAKLGLELIRAHLANGTVGQAEGAVRPLIESLDSEHSELALRLEAELLVSLRQGLAASPAAHSRLDELASGITGATPAERMLLSQMAVATAVRGGSAEEVARLAEAALGGGRLLADETSESLVAYVPLYPLLCADRFEAVERYLEAAFADAAERGSPTAFALASTFRSYLQLCRGDVKAAEGDAVAGLDIFRSFRVNFMTAGGAEPLISAFLETGELDRAAELLQELHLDGPVPDFVPGRVLLSTRGRLRLEQGRLEEGMADLVELRDREDAKGRSNLFLTPYRQWLAAGLASSGSPEEAQALSRKELARARAWGPGRLLALNLIAASRLAGREEGIELLREAVEVTKDSPAKLAAAQALAELGAAVRRAGKRLEAIDLLRAGLDQAHRCGAEATARRAQAELVVLGARPRRRAQSGAEALTAAERRVAELAARGLTNRQIAESLFLTQRTVEHHLTATYLKLGISSRSELRL